MESITKNRQSSGTLKAMVARAYGPGQVPEGDATDWATEFGNGWFNVAYRIRLRDGAEVVLKIAPPPGVEVLSYERGAMATELAALELIATHTGVPVPAVHHADTSHELCDADYFFMPFIQGDNLALVREKLPPAERHAYGEALGAANRELNGIRGAAFGRLTGPGHPSWRSFFTGMVEDILQDGERRAVELGFGYGAVRAVLAEHAPALDEVTEPRFVEWDLWDGNVLVRDGEIAGVIDHERAFFGDPLAEHGFLGVHLPAFGDPAAFLRGYGSAPVTQGEVTRHLLYCLYLSLVMVIETVYREFADAGPYVWARERLVESMTLLGATTGNPGGDPPETVAEGAVA
jgi:aminoglycoside phosphotransferase (APT) family kinase protein